MKTGSMKSRIVKVSAFRGTVRVCGVQVRRLHHARRAALACVMFEYLPLVACIVLHVHCHHSTLPCVRAPAASENFQQGCSLHHSLSNKLQVEAKEAERLREARQAMSAEQIESVVAKTQARCACVLWSWCCCILYVVYRALPAACC